MSKLSKAQMRALNVLAKSRDGHKSTKYLNEADASCLRRMTEARRPEVVWLGEGGSGLAYGISDFGRHALKEALTPAPTLDALEDKGLVWLEDEREYVGRASDDTIVSFGSDRAGTERYLSKNPSPKDW